MKAMEKNLVGMVREVERLRAEVLNAEKRAHGNFPCLSIWCCYQLRLFLDSSILIPFLLILAPNPRNGGYMNPDSYYTATMPGASAYVDGYGRPYVSMGNRPLGEGIIPYASSSSLVAAATAAGVPTAGDGAIWGTAYNPS